MAYLFRDNPTNYLNPYVPDTLFGRWFMSTNIWRRYVLEDAVITLNNLVGSRLHELAVVLDVGCGRGLSFSLIYQYFKPSLISAYDMDYKALESAKLAGNDCRCDVEINTGSVQELNVPDNSFDVVFCHQVIHHVVFRKEVMDEFYRALKPGGLLLLSESCQSFLSIYWVRWLFRHPKMAQMTAAEYVGLVRDSGFCITEHDIMESTPWWSRRDFGLMERMGLQFWKLKTTEICLVATKPVTTLTAPTARWDT